MICEWRRQVLSGRECVTCVRDVGPRERGVGLASGAARLCLAKGSDRLRRAEAEWVKLVVSDRARLRLEGGRHGRLEG